MKERRRFKHFLLLNDSNLELTDLGKYIGKMGQDGAWAGHPEIYVAAMCYKVNVMIYFPRVGIGRHMDNSQK